jgi:uncharacterized SAM-binding protein YcdF (DUF218 family)
MYNFLVWHLLQPYPVLLIFLAVGIAILWRKHRDAWRPLLSVTLGFVLLVVVSAPDVAYLLQGSLEWRYPPLERRPADADGIVVLAGYVHPPASVGARPELGEDSLDRCLWAAELYHQGKRCPVLVSGGNSNPDQPAPAAADEMCKLLVQLGVRDDDLIVENKSRTTHENAAESQRLLKERGLTKVLLVTDAAHLHRALACFRQAGIDAIPCGCQYRARSPAGEMSRFVPSAEALEGFQRACHEWIGLGWYWLRGRI